MKYLTFVFLMMLIISCSQPQEGIVVLKEHQPEITYKMLQTESEVYEQERHLNVDHEDWILVVSTLQSGKVKEIEVYVTQNRWLNIEVGETWKFQEGDSFSDFNNESKILD